MAESPDRVVELYNAIRQASRNAFLFQNVLAELTETEVAVLEKICLSYAEKQQQSSFKLIGYRHRDDLEPRIGQRLKRLFTRRHY